MIIHNPVITGSLQVNGTSVSSIAEVDNISGSVVTLTDASASLAAGKLNNTTDTLTGDLTVTGKITAQEFHTEYVSASIIYQSGSTKFGDSSDDIHTFRGQLFVSASDVESIITSKNYSATGAPEQFQIRHSNGSDIIESKRGSLTLAGGGIYLSGSNTYLYNKLIDTIFASSFVDFSDNGNTVVSSNNDTVLGYLQNTYVKQSGNVGIKTSTANQTLTVNGDFKAVGLWTNTNSQTFWGNAFGDTAYGFLTWDTGYSAISATSGNNLKLGANGNTDFAIITTTGTLGIGTLTPSAGVRLQATGKTSSAGASGIPSLGTAVSSSVALFTNGDEAYGTLFGTLNSGVGWIQQQRVDGTATGYNLLLQPNGGNVGVGTTNPGEKLHVNGNIRLFSAGYPYIDLGVATNNYFRLINDNPNDTFLIQKNGGTLVRLAASGNLGIGDISPARKLHVVDTNPQIRVSYDTASDPRYAELSWYGISVNAGDSANAFSITMNGGDSSNGHINFLTGPNGSTSEKMRITQGGNVGIGTTSPNAILHAGSTGTNAYSTTISKGSNMKGIVTTVASNTDDMVGIYFGTGATTEGTHWSGITGARSDNASHWGTQLNFYTHDNNVNALNDATQKMVIKGDGNVGINVTAPSEKLTVDGNIRIQGTGNQLLFDTLDSGGSNGIRTINNYETVLFNGRGAAGFAVIGNSSIRLGFGTSYTAAQSSIYIPSSGTVGIATGTPRSLLHVARRGNVNGGTMLIGDGESATNKWSFLAGAHRDQATGSGNGVGAAGIALIGSYGDSTDNHVYVGGGPYEINAATKISFHTHTSNLSTLGGSPRMTIDSTGNVGIGTTSPYIGAANGQSGTETLTPKLHLWSDTSGVNPTLHISCHDTDESSLLLSENSGAGGEASAWGSRLYYQGSGDNFFNIDILDSGVQTHRFTINRYGSVGIGTNSPDALLDVHSNSFYGSAASFQVMVNNNNAADTDLSFSSNHNKEKFHFRGSHEILLGKFPIRDGSRYLDLKLNINSNSYMFGARAIGYLYSRAVIDSQVGGYTYIGNSILNKYQYQSASTGNTLDAYRASGGELCLRIDSGNNGYSEGQVYVYFYGHGNNNAVQVANYIQNDSPTNYYA